MIFLITEIDVYAPEPLGVNDVLIANGKVIAIQSKIAIPSPLVKQIDGRGKRIFPGLIDSLVHISGGGGEGGFHTRTPEMPLTDATLSGVTTVIGALGTDGTTRSLADLLAKTRGLENEGISAFCYSGSYQVPVRTLTGDLTDDIVLIDKMIGVGEIAIADHRGSQLSAGELARVASQVRIGGMLSGKAGVVCIHTGDSAQRLTLLHQVIEQHDIPAKQFYPTHINRNKGLLDAGIQWCKAGGVIDMTTSTNQQFIDEGEIPAADAVAYCLRQGIPASQLTMSSDGNASLPVFDNQGELIGLEVGKVESLYTALKTLVSHNDIPFADCVATVTSTPASILGLKHKGRLQVGMDADMVITAADLQIDCVFAKGGLMVENGKALQVGTFEALP